MEIQPLLTGQRAKIDVHRPPKSVPTRKSVFLLALDVPERIAYVLKIEFHTALEQACALAAPVPEEMAVWALTRFVTVWARERLLLRSLRANWESEQANGETQGKQEATLSTAQARHLPPPTMIDLALRTDLL